MTRNPFEELEEMLERMSRQVEEGVGSARMRSVPVDLREDDDAFVVLADLPGFEADEVDLRLSGRHLEIEAERDREETVEDEGYVRRERTRSSVSRSVRIPEEVDEEDVSATLDGGVLTVTLPKHESESGRTIEIED